LPITNDDIPSKTGSPNSPACLTTHNASTYNMHMDALEFTADLTPEPFLPIPQDIADQLPKSGRARVIVLPIAPEAESDPDDTLWRAGAYEQFLRDDPPEDAVYDNY
jgi:hypothetical protein